MNQAYAGLQLHGSERRRCASPDRDDDHRAVRPAGVTAYDNAIATAVTTLNNSISSDLSNLTNTGAALTSTIEGYTATLQSELRRCRDRAVELDELVGPCRSTARTSPISEPRRARRLRQS